MYEFLCAIYDKRDPDGLCIGPSNMCSDDLRHPTLRREKHRLNSTGTCFVLCRPLHVIFVYRMPRR